MKLTDLQPSKHLKLLAYGDSGTGKTCFLGGWPGRIYIADQDGKIGSLARHLERNNKAKLEEIDYDNFAQNRASANYYNIFYTKLVEHEKLAAEGKFPYGTWALDSLTTFSESLMSEILRQNTAIKSVPGVPAQAHYGIFAAKFRETIMRILALPCNVVVNAHIEQTKDESTGEILRQPMVAGKNAKWLPIVFSEVYRTYAETKDGKTIYMAQTKTDAKFNCRSEIPGLPFAVELKYENLVKAW